MKADLAGNLVGLKPRIDECIHCGFCLPTCPTYAELGTETDSPRGRIFLVKALAERRIGLAPEVLRHLDGCLDCRACETACPSGVRYGEIIEGARSAIEPFRRRTLWARALRYLAFRHLLPNRRHLGLAARLLALYQASGLGRFLPSRLRRMDELSPRIRTAAFMGSAPLKFEADPPRRGRVGLFVGCVMDQAMAPIHRATCRVLSKNGFEVAIPRAQTCCGALHVHNGEAPIARELARRNIRAFQEAGVDRILVNSAGCSAQLRETEHLLPGDSGGRWLAEATLDASVFLAREGLRGPPKRVRARAAYDEPCHLLHAQRVREEPLTLLRKIQGIEIMPLDEADWCCGSAGIYSLTQPELSDRILERKMRRVQGAGADLLVTANPGCLIQLSAGIRRFGLSIPVVHILELLDRAY